MWSRSGVQQMHWSFTGEPTRTPCSGTTEWDSDDSDSTNSQVLQACRSMVEVQEEATPGPRPKKDHGLPRGFQLCEQRQRDAMDVVGREPAMPVSSGRSEECPSCDLLTGPVTVRILAGPRLTWSPGVNPCKF
ncbi:unnamed protein product [Symbiodinium sp. CCMP2456]|nr:unnamed protein product [Symbiodinium sp. CCMP2456]